MESRNLNGYDWPEMNDDWLPLHPDFYQLVQQDESGAFIELPDGTRFTVRLKEVS